MKLPVIVTLLFFHVTASAENVLTEQSVKREGYVQLFVDNAPLPNADLYFLIETKDGRFGLEKPGFDILPFQPRAGWDIRCSPYLFTSVCWLDQIPKAKIRFDEPNQALYVGVPPEWRKNRSFDLGYQRPNFKKPNYRSYGLAVNYSTSLLHNGNNLGGGVLLDAKAYLGESILTHSFSASSSDWLLQNRPSSRIRTTLSTHYPNNRQILELGDSITGTGFQEPYRRRINFAGINIYSDVYAKAESQQPTFAIEGVAAEPSTLQLFVDSQQVFTSDTIPKGPFTVTSLPGVSNGNVSVVIKDALGREKVVARPFFRSHRLLGKDKDIYEISLGFIRQNLGIESFDYGDPIFTGQYGYGFSNQTTGSVAWEFTPEVVSLGYELGFGISEINSLLSVRHAASSHRDDGSGGIYSLGLTTDVQPVRFSGSLNYYDKNFRQVGSNGFTQRKDYRIGLNFDTGNNSSMDFTYARIFNRDASSSKSSILRGRYFDRTEDDVRYGFSASVDPSSPEDYQLSFTLGYSWDGVSYSASHRIHPDPQTTNYAINRGVSTKNIGFDLNYFTDYADQQQLSASLSGLTEAGEFNAFMSDSNGTQNFAFSVNGSVAVFDSTVIASRTLESNITVVRSEGVQGARVTGGADRVTTDSGGYAILRTVQPYTELKVGVISESERAAGLEPVVVVPPYFGANFVELSSTTGGHLTLTLKLPSGKFVPVGAQMSHVDADLSARNLMIVGVGGFGYVVGLKGDTTLNVRWNSIGACTAKIALPKNTNDPLPDLGEVICVPLKK